MKNLQKFCTNKQKSGKRNATPLFIGGLALFAFAAILGIMLGSTKVSFSQLLGGDRVAQRIFLYVRLPRTAACLICGAALAVSGAVTQGVLANRLASPSVIGVNSGAGLAVTLCAACGIYGGWQLSLFAFAGAFATVTAVSLAARRWGNSHGTIILLGVAVNSLLNAASDGMISLNPDLSAISSGFKLGEFSSVTAQTLVPAAVLVLLALAVLFTLGKELDVLGLGEDNAAALGLNTKLVRTVLLLLAALLAGCAVSLAGLVSFVGLLVPHAVRRLCGGGSGRLLPLCALYGGAFVCLCDTAARTLFAPYELPVGIIMAFFGAPFFVFILFKGKGGDRI